MIKFHILLKVGKPRNIKHMLTQFYKRDLHQNVDIRKKCKGVGKKKRQIIYQKPGDCLKHLIRSPGKMCATNQEIQVLKQNPCMANWKAKEVIVDERGEWHF